MDQSNNQQSPNMYPEDEISLKDLFQSIWKTRVTWVVALIIATSVFWAVWGVKMMSSPILKTYSLSANLVFENVDKDQYPNKTRFLQSDIVTPSILRSVFVLNQLEKYNLKQSDFDQMINVAPYAPSLGSIQLKYEKKLSDTNKLTPQDIDLIQGQKNQEILLARKGGVLLQLTELKANQLPINIVYKVLQDIYKIWADKAINERNVLSSDLSLIGSLSVQKELSKELDYAIALDFVKEKMRLVKSLFNLILSLPNAKTIVDPETGLSIDDMSRSIDDRLIYQLKLVEAPIVQLGISRYKDLTTIYYNEELYNLKEKSKMLDLKASAIQKTLEQYNGVLSKDELGTKVVSQSSVSPQVNSDFLDKIISLSGESTDAKYKQNLANKILELKSEKTEILVKHRALERKINALSQAKLVGNDEGHIEDTDENKLVKETTIKMLNLRLPEMLGLLSEYLAATKRIYNLLDKEALKGNGNLYQLTGEGLKSSGGIKNEIKSTLLNFFIVLFLVTIIVVPWKMIKNSN